MLSKEPSRNSVRKMVSKWRRPYYCRLTHFSWRTTWIIFQACRRFVLSLLDLCLSLCSPTHTHFATFSLISLFFFLFQTFRPYHISFYLPLFLALTILLVNSRHLCIEDIAQTLGSSHFFFFSLQSFSWKGECHSLKETYQTTFYPMNKIK